MELSGLNEQQRAAVECVEGPLLLLAGAGSGKTRVITCRIAYLLLVKKVPAKNLLAVTFTNKAAREMKERVVEMVGKKAVKGMVIATFHSLCVRILKEEIERLGFKGNFSIYGTSDQLSIIRVILQELDLDGQKFDAERILWKISDAKNALIEPKDYRVRFHEDEEYMAAQVYPRYQKALKAYNAIDFDDIIMLAVKLLREFPEVLEKFRQRYRYLMVDEYQDTNAAQYRLMQLLAGGHRNLCVVGDDDQSIYGWRGADLGNILNFEQDFPGTTVIKLEQNYRSTGNILGAANAVIKNNRKRKEKALWTSGGSGRAIEYHLCEDGEDEARMVMELIHAEKFREERQYSDFAILYRTNVQSRAFEEQLRYENIPYVLIGGQQFFDRKEVKDAVAYLKVLVNEKDEVNLLRILNYPKRGIGETTADRLIRHSTETGVGLWGVLKNAGELDELPERAREAIAGFVEMLGRYRHRFARKGELARTVREFFEEIGLEQAIYKANDDPQKARRQVENLEEVVSAVASFEERDEDPDLPGFLEKVSLLDDHLDSSRDKEKKLARNAVTLMSLHSSKGLEFPCVFLVGMEEEFLPHKKSLTETFDVDEERRLCYVGITRAREHLVLLGALQRKKYGKLLPRVQSRFLAEIPQELLEKKGGEKPAEMPREVKEQKAKSAFANIFKMLD